jgi:hypothetical protein
MIPWRAVFIPKCNMELTKKFEINKNIKITSSGPDGLKFLKDDIKVSKDGLIKMMDGNNNPVVQPFTKDDIEVIYKFIIRLKNLE